MMTLNDQQNYYEVLDVKPDASPQEIREAYLRIKSTYNKDSVALYSLINAGEREEMLRLIEEAYDILSHTERRKEYDRYQGLIDSRTDFDVRPPAHKKIVSIDRMPPMESMDSLDNGDELLVAPNTDFSTSSRTHIPAPSSEAAERPAPAPTPPPAPPAASATPAATPALPAFNEERHSTPRSTPAATAAAEARASILQEIEHETEWTGLFLKRVREARNISLEEMSAITKISKTYLQALEDENYAKLPAPVFVRGFVIQVSRQLRLPQDKVAAAYMGRLAEKAPPR